MTDIQAKIFRQDAKRRNGRIVQEAGYVVYNPETSKNLDNRVFATEADAQTAIPGILAVVAGNIARNEQRAAATEKALATVETGWSNASRRTKGIGSRSLGLFLPTPDDAAGGCYYCGVKGCTECGTD